MLFPQSFSGSALAALVKGLPETLERQFEYEDPVVRGGKQLLHSPFFKVRGPGSGAPGSGVGSSRTAPPQGPWARLACKAAGEAPRRSTEGGRPGAVSA